jgi:predicted protein tyrosine phosphatase
VLVNCWAGRSRSAAVIAAYLMAQRRRTYDEAVWLLLQQRPAIAINPVSAAAAAYAPARSLIAFTAPVLCAMSLARCRL